MAKYKILIVDDEPDNLQLLYRTLRGKYDIMKAQSPAEALEILKDNDFQCIISDHKMPGMDGVEFLKLSSESHPNAIRLLVTAYSDVKILIDAINYARIYRYIKKPYAPDELAHIVEASLEYYQLKVDNETLIKDLKELFSGTIKAFTLGRSRRVAFYSAKMVEFLNLDKAQAGIIELAGLLHDIGMIGVAEDILNKTQRLTDEEFEEIKKHVQHSVKILEDIKQLYDVIEIIKYHHEYYDGKKGTDIPLGSRIIAIADAYDSMVSNRAYRQGLSPDEAVRLIEEKAGVQFDPELIGVFKSILPAAAEEIKDFETKMKFHIENEEQALGH